MEAMNGLLGDGEKGVAQPPSPLTGCYLLIVVGEPCKEQHKDIILQRITKGLLSWDVKDCMVDLEKELAIITEHALDGEEARYGERLIQFASENLVTEILIHPAVSTLVQCMRNLLGSFTRHRHIIHAGYTFAANGSWALQDGTFSYSDFSESFQELDVQRILHAYENGISLDLHCSPEGDWPRLPKEPFAKACRARVNPADVLGSGSTHLKAFLEYLAGFLRPATLEKMLASSEVVGNIRFSRPTLYVFPGGQGDAALFGINGFNMLLDGGFSRKACFWDFVRHLDRLDAVLLTRLNNSNVGGISSILRRKKQDVVYPQIGHFFCNIQERRTLPSPDGDKDKDPLLINLLDEGQEIISNLRYLNLHPQPCYRDIDPINLYHKVGHGTLDMYVLSPSKDSKEVKDFLHKWNHSDQKLFAGSKSRDFNFPVQNLVSVAALLVWQPANPTDTITRILFPGSSPQSKIFEGLDKLKSLECVKRPTCSVKSLQPLSAQKKAVIERITPKEKLLVKENKTIENNIINGDVKEKTVKKSDSTESDRSTRAKKVEESKLVENGDKPKPKSKPKVRSESQQRKKPPEKKASPTTPKKTEAAEAKKPAKPSPLGTPAKSTKDANNRKVVESKVKREAIKTAPAKPRVESRPLAKKPAAKKAPTSPSKKLTNGVQKPDSISRKGKLDKEGTTDSSTVSTPSVDQESILKKELSQEDIQKLQAQELADLKEEQEAVKEIEAVFRKGESQPGKAEELRAVKDVSLEDKEEYIVIEKEVIEQESLGGETKEDEIQKLARDSEESEKPRRLSADAADKEVLSPEDRPDVSSDKKTTDKEIEEVKDVVESHPDEKISANIKSGDTTTAPTLPEDERIPLDEIKEDGYAVEEKHVKEETKEKGLPVIQLPQKTFESVPKIPGAVGIRLDKQQLIRDIVKTPDEVADLPVHEEVDYEYTHELRTEPVKTNEVQEAKAEQQAQMVFPKEKQKEVELEEKDKDEVNNDAKEELEELQRLTDAVHENEDSEKGTIGVGLQSDIKQKSSETKIEAVAEHGIIPTGEGKIETATIENIKDEGDQKDLQKGIVLPERRSPEEKKKDSGDHTVEFEKSHERREEELVGKVETESQLGENLVLEDPKSKAVEKEMPKAVGTETKTPEEEKEQVVVIEDREKEVQKEKTETEFTKNISVHETIGSYSEPEKQEGKVAEESGKTESKLDEHVSDESKKITEAFRSDIKEVRHESVEKQLGINEAEEVISHAATSKTESEFKEEEESGELLHKDSGSDIKEETETASREIVEAVTKTQTKQEEDFVLHEDATKKKENEKIEPALDKGPIMLVQEKMSSDIPEKLKEQTQQEMPENEEKGITTKSSEVSSKLDHGKVKIEEMETEPNTTECEKDTDNIVLVNKSVDNIQEPAPKEKVEAEKKVHSGEESEELEMVDQEALKKVTGTETIENKAKGDLKAEVPTALNEVKTKEQQEHEDEALADQEIAAAELKPQAAPEAIEKIELGRKSPKEREEDVIKIVASVAEVLKSDAPLEEFTGKLPINTFGSYTTELRETHITTMDSPLIETKVIKTDIPTIPEEPHTASASFIDEEIKAYTMQESEDKRVSLLKESQEFMKATSKMLSDIKATTEKSIPTEEPDAKEKIDDDDVSAVHRMLVTASSEDGGEEIEICPAGSIIFSKSSESSGRSSPDPSQKTQKSSMVDTSESLSTVRQILDDQTQREIYGLASQEIETEAPKDKITEHGVKSGPQNIEETVVAGATKIGEAEIIEKVLQDKISQKTIQSSEEKLQKEYATDQLEDSLANENDAAEKNSEKVGVQQTRKESTSQLGKEELATIECQIEQKASMQENQEVLPNTPADVGHGKLGPTLEDKMPPLEDMKPPHPEPASADQEQLQPAETQPKIQETMSTQSQAARPDVKVSKDSKETVEVSAAKDDHEDDKKDEVVTLQTSQKEEASPESTSLDHKLTKDIENEFYDDTEVVILKTGEQLEDIKKIGDKELLKDSVETTGSLEEHCGKIKTDSDVERAETESEHKISEATDHETDSFMKGLTATTSKVIANIFQEVENETKDKLDEMESSIEILQTSVIGSATKIDKDIDDVVVDLKKETDDIKSMADHHIDAVTKSVVDLPKDLANIKGKLGQKEEEFDCSSQVVSAEMKDTTDYKTEVEVETTKEALKENVTQQLEDKSLFQDISEAANESINALGEAAESIAGKITGLFEKTEDLCKEKHEQVVGAVALGIETIQSKMTIVGDDLKVHQEITDEVKDATTVEYSIQSATDVHQVISVKETCKTEQTTGDKDQEKEAGNVSRIVPDSKSDSTETESTKIKSDVKNEEPSEKTQKIGTPPTHIEDVAVGKPDESSTESSKKSVTNGFGSELSEEASHEKSDFEAQTVSSKLIPEPQTFFNKESAEGKKIDTNIETKSETLNLSNAHEKLQSDQEKMDEKTLKQEEILVDSAQDLEETFETVSDMSKSVVFEKMSSEKKTVESGPSGEVLDETDTKEGSKHKVADNVKESVDEYKEDKLSETLMPTKEKGEGKDTADQKVVEVESQILTAASKDVKEDSNDSVSDQKQQEVQEKINNQLEESVRDINEKFETVAQSLSSLTFDKCEKINDEQITDKETISQSVDTPKCSDDDSFDIPKEVLKDKEEKLKDSAEDVKETYDELNQLSQSIQFDKCDKVDQKNWTANSKDSVIEPPKSYGEDTRKEKVQVPNEMEEQLEKSAEDLGDTYDNVAQLSKSVSFEKCEKTSEHKENPKPNDAPAQLEVSVSSEKCDKIGTKGSEVEEMAKALGHTSEEMIKSHESEKDEKETMEKSTKQTAHFVEGNNKTELQVAELESRKISVSDVAVSLTDERSAVGSVTEDPIGGKSSDQKHITPPTVPVSPNVLEEVKFTSRTDALIKEVGLRSSTPGSDDSEMLSSHTEAVSERLSKIETPAQSDEDDDQPSMTSQIAHSRESSLCEGELRQPEIDPMRASFPQELPCHLFELTQAKFASSSIHEPHRALPSDTMSASFMGDLPGDPTETWSEPSGLPTPAGDGDEFHGEMNLMTASFYGELPSETDDPIRNWGKPLGLPSPAPPSDNKGTPKKERRVPSSVSTKNKLNDEVKKRAESPSKYSRNNKKTTSTTPVYVDLTYVPHHGNTYYACVEFFKRVRARYYVFSGIEPSKEVYDALLEGKQTWEDKELEVTIIPTYDTDILGYWVAENEEILTKLKIDLSPSASRCTINLQDHETSCSAYRLEF